MKSVSRVAISSVVLGVLIGCGGSGGGTSNSNGNNTCGPNFLTPNYVQAFDPGSSQQNIIRHWESFPVTLKFENAVTFNDGGTLISTNDLGRSAIGRWSTTAGTALVNEVTGVTSALITVRINQIGAQPGAGGTLAVTTTTYFPSNNQLVSAEIEINVWPGMTRNQFVNGLRHTMTHEFGHALFLQGHSDQAADTMYYQSDPSVDVPLTTRDKNSLKTAYCGDFSSNLVSRAPIGEQPVTERIELRAPSKTESAECVFLGH